MSNQHTARSKTRLNALSFTLVVEELLSGPCTVDALTEASGLERRTIYLLLRTMYEHKVVHIASYEKDALGRIGTRVYGLGEGKDAKKPTKTGAQACKEWRQRQKVNAAGAMMASA